MVDRDALVEAVKVALSRACPNEHTINKRDEANGSVTFWITCSDQQLSSINFPASSHDPSLEISYWKYRTMDEHRWSLAPATAVDAALNAASEPPRRDAEGSESQVAPGLLADEERSAPSASSDACNFGTHNHESIVDVKDGRLWCFTHNKPCPYDPPPTAAPTKEGERGE